MTVREILALLKRYAVQRGSSFTRKDFVAWGAHHGLSRRTPSEFIDDAFHEAQAERAVEMIPSTPHPLWRAAPLDPDGRRVQKPRVFADDRIA